MSATVVMQGAAAWTTAEPNMTARKPSLLGKLNSHPPSRRYGAASRALLPRRISMLGFLQPAGNQVVRVIDHLPDLAIGNSCVELDRVPMFLVHVITRLDLLVSVAELKRQIGIAFQVRGNGKALRRRQCKHLTADFED